MFVEFPKDKDRFFFSSFTLFFKNYQEKKCFTEVKVPIIFYFTHLDILDISFPWMVWRTEASPTLFLIQSS